MKVYTKVEMKIEWNEVDAFDLARVGDKIDILRSYQFNEMISTETGEVITEEDLDTASRVLECLLENSSWSVSCEE